MQTNERERASAGHCTSLSPSLSLSETAWLMHLDQLSCPKSHCRGLSQHFILNATKHPLLTRVCMFWSLFVHEGSWLSGASARWTLTVWGQRPGQRLRKLTFQRQVWLYEQTFTYWRTRTADGCGCFRLPQLRLPAFKPRWLSDALWNGKWKTFKDLKFVWSCGKLTLLWLARDRMRLRWTHYQTGQLTDSEHNLCLCLIAVRYFT